MNKETEEILDGLKKDVEENILIEVRGIYYKPLLDYITNLQEENERLKEQLDMLVKDDEKQQKIIIELQERIDKAIEYIERKQEDINNGGNDMSYQQLTHLLDILRGKDNE